MRGGWLLAAHTELQTIRKVSHARLSNYLKVFISMYDPFSNDDDPDARALLRGAERDEK